MKLLRKETMTAENDLEDLKRKKIKRATAQQLDALEKLGKEMIVIAYYGREIMDQVDDTPTEAGQYAEDRYGQYDGKQPSKAPPEKMETEEKILVGGMKQKALAVPFYPSGRAIFPLCVCLCYCCSLYLFFFA